MGAAAFEDQAAGRDRRIDLAAAFLLAATASAFFCLTVWPGFMSFDSLHAYRQSLTGVETAIWPPVHDYLFFVFRHLPGNPGGLLVFQSFALFLSANLIIRHAAPSAWVSIPLMVVFFALFFLFPTLAGAVIVLWKDVALATFALMAVAIWLSGTGHASALKTLCLFTTLTVAIALRYNALPLLLPFMVLIALNPAGPRPHGRQRLAACIGLLLSVAIAYASTVWRLPDLERLPPVTKAVASIKLWDIVGTSACEGRSLLTDLVGDGDPLSVQDLRAVYDPRHVNLMFENPIWKARVGGRFNLEQMPLLEARWRSLPVDHTRCYLATRLAVFREQMGLNPAAVFYPTHGGIDANPYGFSLAFPERANGLIQMIMTGANAPLRRGYVLMALALPFLLASLWRDRWRFTLPLALYLGSLGFLALLFFAAPAADARYLFPCNVFAALVMVLSLARLASGRRPTVALGAPERTRPAP